MPFNTELLLKVYRNHDTYEREFQIVCGAETVSMDEHTIMGIPATVKPVGIYPLEKGCVNHAI